MGTSVRKFWLVGAAMLLPVSFAVAQSGKVCVAQQYGAKGDGTTLDTVAIQKAIDDCAASGGGVVRLAGAAKFVSAPLVLKNHITLEIAAGTTLEGSANHDDYPEIEQFHDKGRQSLLSAKDAVDITIRGGGVIDGRGDSWWSNPHQTRPRLIVFDHCKHVLMENVTVENSPMWQIVPYYSDDLTFRNMKVLAPEPAGHNTDGIDPFSSGHILIDHVTIDTGDDNVAIKSGQPGSPGPDAPSHDITVRDCTFLHGHGMSVGSEVSGGVQHVLVERVRFNGTTQGIRLKSGRDRGGDLSDFTYRDITMEDVKTAVQITDYYGGDRAGAVTATSVPVTRLTPHFDGIRIENLKVSGAKVGLDIEGLPEAPIKNLVMDNVVIQADKAGKIYYANVTSRGLNVVGHDGQPLTIGAGVTGSLK